MGSDQNRIFQGGDLSTLRTNVFNITLPTRFGIGTSGKY